MKKIIEVLILIGGLMMIISCSNPYFDAEDGTTTDTNTEVQNGGNNGSNATPSTIYSIPLTLSNSNNNIINNFEYADKYNNYIIARLNGNTNTNYLIKHIKINNTVYNSIFDYCTVSNYTTIKIKNTNQINGISLEWTNLNDVTLVITTL